jgi:membrane protein YqaA with SNARE-associated domain
MAPPMTEAPHWLLHIRDTLLAFGLPGLCGITFLDSGVAGVPGGPDVLVMLLAWRSPDRAWLVALSAALGAVGGGLIRYSLARKAGELALRRFAPERREWAHRAIDSHGIWTVFLACLIPPPFPLSFVLMAAGAFQMRVLPFLAGCVPGRLVRYGALAYLGVHYGKQAASVVAAHLPIIVAVLAASTLATALLLLRGTRKAAG